MRVLHVSSGNMFGGVETLLVTLARSRHLCPAMEPHFAVCFRSRVSDELRQAGVAVHHVADGVRIRNPASVWRARRALRSLLQGGEFDVVVCHAAWSHAIFAPEVRSAKVPLVFFLHDVPSGTHWLERWAGRTPPDLAICNSQFVASTHARLHPGVPAAVLHCPVASPTMRYSDAERRALRAELQTAEDAVVVIQVSRMEPWKGHSLHLKALQRLRDVPGWISWQVGGAQRSHEAEYLAELLQVANQLGIEDRVRFLGQRPDVARLLSAADIYCQPNTGPEPFGITFVEALYAGLPVVTTALGGALEIVDESCGVLVPPGDADALAAVLGSLIQDPATRYRLAAAGPARARVLSDPMLQLAHLDQLLTSTVHPEMAC